MDVRSLAPQGVASSAASVAVPGTLVQRMADLHLHLQGARMKRAMSPATWGGNRAGFRLKSDQVAFEQTAY